ncbi:MAG: ankyrin repeat domain-containing protein [Pseudomonadota bacterium]|nr:ankyrin repeat domain-containing protein [Pseudomonadota bacterium]
MTDADTALHDAALKGDNEAVVAALEAGADIHAQQDTALYVAARFGHTGTVVLLLDRGADIHAQQDKALQRAAYWGHTDTVALLLDRGADIHAVQDAALHLAAENGHTGTVALLLDRGADIHAQQDTALYMAAQYGHTGIVALLLDRGADIHAQQDKALQRAAYRGHTDTVALLFDRGVDIHAQQDEALYVAAQYGHTGIVARLLDRGVDIHARQDAALHLAAENGHTDTVALLLDRGADIHARYAAARNGHTSIVAWLLDRSADIYAWTTLQRGGYTVTVALLNSYEGLEKIIHACPAAAREARALVYQSAAVAARLGFDSDAIVGFADGVMRQNASDTALSRQAKDKAIDLLQLVQLEREAKNQPDRLSRQIGIGGYLEAGNIRDMVNQYVDCVMLPQLMLDAKLPHSYEPQGETLHRLSAMAATLLFHGKRLDQILDMSRAWHVPGNAIPDETRPLRGGKWQPLINTVATPYTNAEEEKIVVRALASQDDLAKETRALRHCVGTASYGSRCQTGNIHILSVQTAAGTPLATAEVTLTGNAKSPLAVNQFRGHGNGNPPEKAQQAWNWFLGEANAGRVRFNQPKDGKWGEIKQENEPPPVIQRIGFEPSKNNIDACLAHYRDHLLLKEPRCVAKRRAGSFYQPRDVEKSYSWVQSVSGSDLGKQIAQCELGGQWRQLCDSVSPQSPAGRINAEVAPRPR